MLISKEVKVKVIPKTMKHYLSKGYICNKFDIINVKIEDLTDGSHCYIDFNCDYCGKNFQRKYVDYKNILSREQFIHKDACNECKHLKQNEIKSFKLNNNILTKNDNGY